MKPDELRAWIRRSPVQIRMNNGDVYDVPSPEFALVSDYSVALLTRQEGQMLNILLALKNISEVRERSESAEQSR